MNTKILLIKFSRTSIKDYCWLIKADGVDQLDYQVLEKIFSEYKLRQVSKENNVNCGLIELTSYFYFFSCYKTIYTDNYNREIYALDALCIKKENIDMICSLYFIFFSNPRKYIQHEQCLDSVNCNKITNNCIIDVSDIFENYILSCKNVDKRFFTRSNFYPIFQGYDNELETRILQIVGNKNTRNIQFDSLETNKEKRCTLFVTESKKFLFGKFRKFIIKGDFSRGHDIIYIEKIFSCNKDLQNYIDKIVKKLDGYIVNVSYSFIN